MRLLASELRPAPVKTPARMRSFHLSDQPLDPSALLSVEELLPVAVSAEDARFAALGPVTE